MIEFVDLMEARSLGSMDSEKDQDKFWYSDQWVMEPVYLGFRYQCLVGASGQLRFHGKQKKYKQIDKFKNLTKIVQSIKSKNLPEDTLFEGYLTFQNDRTKAFKFLKLEQLDNEMINIAQFYISDIIYHSGRDLFNLPLFDRRTIINKLFVEDDVVKIQHGYVKDKKKIYQKMKDEVQVFIFKDLSARYNFKQSLACRIYKTPFSYFMVAMGFVESADPRLKRMVVAIEGGQLRNNTLVKIMNIPVHGNDTRIILYNNRSKYLGKVFEFLASEKLEKDEKYQEARFVKMRDDKKLENCIFL